MAYQYLNQHNGKFYELHYRDVTLKSGYVSRIYFFVEENKPGAGETCDLPAGYEVAQSRGLVHLRKKAA